MASLYVAEAEKPSFRNGYRGNRVAVGIGETSAGFRGTDKHNNLSPRALAPFAVGASHSVTVTVMSSLTKTLSGSCKRTARSATGSRTVTRGDEAIDTSGPSEATMEAIRGERVRHFRQARSPALKVKTNVAPTPRPPSGVAVIVHGPAAWGHGVNSDRRTGYPYGTAPRIIRQSLPRKGGYSHSARDGNLITCEPSAIGASAVKVKRDLTEIGAGCGARSTLAPSHPSRR